VVVSDIDRVCWNIAQWEDEAIPHDKHSPRNGVLLLHFLPGDTIVMPVGTAVRRQANFSATQDGLPDFALPTLRAVVALRSQLGKERTQRTAKSIS
jgi:hypothetical protein